MSPSPVIVSPRLVSSCLLLVLYLSAATGSTESQCTFCKPTCKKITVSSNGNNTSDCVKEAENTPCRDLSYALSNYEPKDQCTVITVTYSHRMLSAVYLSGVTQLAIIGVDTPTISCVPGAGLALSQSDEVLIEGLQWIDCSISHQTTFHGLNGTSSLFVYQSTNVAVIGCHLSSMFGAGVSLYDVGGNVTISRTTFTGIVTPDQCATGVPDCVLLGGGLLVEFTKCGSFKTDNCSMDASLQQSRLDGAMYQISDCVFANNTDAAPSTSNGTQAPGGDKEKQGAGFVLSLFGNNSGNFFNIVGNSFENNSYLHRPINSGGIPHAVLTIHIAGGLEASNISLVNNSFHGNTGVFLDDNIMDGMLGYEGAALAISINCTTDRPSSQNSIKIDRCCFSENAAVSGAVVLVLSTENQELDTESFHVIFSNTTWDYNIGNDSGAAVTLYSASPVPSMVVAFENCTWQYNLVHYHPSYTLVLTQNLYSVHMGTVVSEGVPLHFAGSTLFQRNSRTALHLMSAVASFTGNVEFLENESLFGGAVHLNRLSWITPLVNLNLLFSDNRAHFGGAIFSSYGCTAAGFFTSCQCRIFADPHGVRICQNYTNIPANTTITFKDNSAILSGNAIYAQDRGCSLRCLHGDGFEYIPPEDRNETSAPADVLTFSSPAVNNEMNVWLGQNIFLNVTTRYEYETLHKGIVMVPAVSIAIASLSCITTFQTQFELSGPKIVYLDSRAFFSYLYVTGTEVDKPDYYSCYLNFAAPDSHFYFATHLKLNLVPCKLGYVYDKKTQKCVCSSVDVVECDSTTMEMDACIKYGYWFGRVAGNTFTAAPCLDDNACSFNYGSCPVGPCANIPEYCKLPLEQNQQCRSNRAGPLCTECLPGYSFSYNARLCVDNSSCTAGYALLVYLIVAAFWIMMITGLFFVLKFNLRVGSGYLYAFIYYFSVLDYITPAYLPTVFLDVLVTFYASIAKLNVDFIGELPVCFLKDVNSLGHHFMQYTNPLFISAVLLIAVLMARCFPRLPNPAKKSGVHAICILLLLSFSSVLEISLNILIPVDLDGKHYVMIQADTRYFDPRNHLPFALVAIFAIVLLVIPFTFLMIFSPLLVRCGVNLTRIKPIMDEYQSCYKDRWRWVAGYYFVCRFIVFGISIIDITTYQQVYIYQFLFLVIFGLHTAFQPYTVAWLNALDSFLLIDLALITMLYGKNADQIFRSGNNEVIRTVFLHILILIPTLYFLGISIYASGHVTGLNRRLCRKYLKIKAHVLHQDQVELLGNETEEAQEHQTSHIQENYYDHDREPLLALLTDNGAPSAARYQALDQPTEGGGAGRTASESTSENRRTSGTMDESASRGRSRNEPTSTGRNTYSSTCDSELTNLVNSVD